jgi:hypothetical protein
MHAGLVVDADPLVAEWAARLGRDVPEARRRTAAATA